MGYKQKQSKIAYIYWQMSFRLFIATCLWLTYALLLGHDLLPHHHHDETELHLDRHAAHQDADHDTDQDEPDWWFAHQHGPGIPYFQTDLPNTHTIPAVAALITYCQVPYPVTVYWPGQTVGWPPTQSKAPPDGQNPFRPLRAPPTSYSLA